MRSILTWVGRPAVITDSESPSFLLLPRRFLDGIGVLLEGLIGRGTTSVMAVADEVE